VDFVLEGEGEQGVGPDDGADGVVPGLLPVEGDAAEQGRGRRHAVRRCKFKSRSKINREPRVPNMHYATSPPPSDCEARY